MANVEFEKIIIDKLLNVSGLSIMNNYIYDDDNSDFLIYNEGMLKTSRDGIFHTNDKVFDPLHDIKLMEYLFTVYITKETIDNGLYVQSTGIENVFPYTKSVQGVTPIKYSLHIYTGDGMITTNPYFNIALSYAEGIFRIAQIYMLDPNIKNYLSGADYTLEEMIARFSKKGR